MRPGVATFSSICALVTLTGCSAETKPAAEDTREPAPVSVPAIQLEGDGPYEPGDILKGRLLGLEEGTYELAWNDGAGTPWAAEFEGPGDREFGFELSYPRFAHNELVLSAAADEGEARQHIAVELPPRGRKGYVRVLEGERDASVLEGMPAEAVLWNPRRVGFPTLVDRPVLLDLAWRLPGLGSSDRPLHLSSCTSGANAAMAVCLGDWPPQPVVDARADAAGFAAFVRSKYGRRAPGDRQALDAVARSWGQTLSSWEEVAHPSRLPDTYAVRSSLAQWADYLEFLEERAASFLRSAAGSVTMVAPGAPVGFFGLESPSAPGTPSLDVIGEYVQWRGGSFRPGMARLAAEFLPAGRPLISRGTSTPYSTLHAALSGCLVQVFGPDERDAALACEPLARGLGRLVEVSNRPRPGGEEGGMPGAEIALVYSHASVRASFLLDAAGVTGKPTGGWPFPELRDASWDRVWEAWCALLADLGVPFVPVTEDDVARGELTSRRFEAAVLVRMLSVSEGAAHALREFADSGGVLVADAGTGMFDGDLVRVPGSEAQKLFGIEHAADARFSEVAGRRRMIAEGGLRFSKPPGSPSWFARPGPLGVGPAEAGLALAGARAEGLFRAVNGGEVPCLTVNSVGGGWAVMLNLAVSAYLELRALPGGGENLRGLVAGVLRRARARPAVELVYGDGTYPPPSIAAIWDSGALRLVAVTRDEHRGVKAARVAIRFESRSPPAVYDLLQGRFVGWTGDVEAELTPGDVRLFALLPYQLRSIVTEPLGAPPGCTRQGPETVEVTLRKTGDAPFEFHVLEVTVEDPAGAAREEYSTLVEVAGGRADFVVPFAASDPPGLWTLRFRDAATGVRAIRRFVRLQASARPDPRPTLHTPAPVVYKGKKDFGRHGRSADIVLGR